MLYRVIKRRISLFEYEAYKVLQDNGIKVPKHVVIDATTNLEKINEKLKTGIKYIILRKYNLKSSNLCRRERNRKLFFRTE